MQLCLRPHVWRLLLLVGLLCYTRPLRADTVFSDHNFDDADWRWSIVNTHGNGGTASAQQRQMGGNPGYYRETTISINDNTSSIDYSSVSTFHKKITAVFYPATQGAIDTIDYSEDALMTVGFAGGQATGVALEQNGNVYVATDTNANFVSWTSLNFVGLHASDFALVGDFNGWWYDSNQHPNFSAAGAPITFGFYRATGSGRAVQNGFTIVCGIDNWSVAVHSVPDSTPPIITAFASPEPNGAEWSNSDVTVSISATDEIGGSGVSKITYSASGAQLITSTDVAGDSAALTVTTEGATTISYWAKDNAGNVSSSGTLTIRLDKTPPSISGSADRVPDNGPWYNHDVTVSFSASDSLSGIADSPVPVTVTTEGAGQSVSGTATDLAGNSATATVSGINIDKTAPVTTASVSGPLGNNGWYRGAAAVTLSGSDALSGISRTTYSLDGGASAVYSPGTPVAVNGDGTHTLTFQSVDLAGNVEAANSLVIKIDSTPPVIVWGTPSPAPNAAGWNNTPVLFPDTAFDATSGVASPGASGTSVISTEGANLSIFMTATDRAGNEKEYQSPSVNIDLTAPAVTAACSPATAKPSAKSANVNVTGTVSDRLSGVVPKSGTYTVTDSAGSAVPGGSFTISSTGTYSFKLALSTQTAKGTTRTYTINVKGRDKADNTGSAVATFTVK